MIRALRPSLLELGVSIVLAPGLCWWALASYTGETGLAYTSEDEVAVVVDYLSGEQTIVTTPGYRLFVPHFQQVFRFDKRPVGFLFEGNQMHEANRYPRLTVRANDGSSFWFDEFELQYAIIPARADELLADSGPGHGYKMRLVNAFARAALRDELGRFSAEEVVLPDVIELASAASKQRLNDLLAPHAVEVLEVGKPKPRFNGEYETAIERRKVANQEIEHLRGKKLQLRQEKAQRIAAVRGKKEAELRTLQGALAQQILATEQDSIRILNEAEIFHLHRTGDGRLSRQRLETEAGAREDRYRMEAEGFLAKAQALEAQGQQAVRSALIERLPQTKFTLVPYAHDPRPERIEYVQTKGEAVP